MPSRHSHRQDPLLRNIERWDDGYDYIDPAVKPPLPTAAAFLPYDPPPPSRPAPSTKTARYIPRSGARSPPPPYDDAPDHPRRPRHRSPSPLRRSHTHRDPEREPRPGITSSKTFPVPPSDRDRDRDRRPRSPSPRRTRARPGRAHHSSSPPPARRHLPDHSPPRRHHPDHHAHHRGSPSPSPPPAPRRAQTTHNPVPARAPRARDHDRPAGSGSGSGSGHSSNSRDHERAPRGGHAPASRPGITRSRTTAAAGELLASPRFQQAARAALQAGGMAALRQWKAPGAWAGQKGASVATAALGAAALDAFRVADAGGGGGGGGGGGDGKRSATPQGGGGRGKEVGSALGGLIVEQLVKGRGGGSKKGRR